MSPVTARTKAAAKAGLPPMPASAVQSQCRRCCDPYADGEDEHRAHDQRDVGAVEQQRGETDKRRDHADQIGQNHQPPDRKAADDTAGYHAADPHTTDQQGQIEADLIGRAVELADEDERCRGDEGIHRGRGAAAADRIAEEGRRANEVPVISGERAAAMGQLLPGFGEQAPGEQEIGNAEAAKQKEDPAPAEGFGDGAADDGCDAGTDRHHQIHQCQAARGLSRRRSVPHDRPGENQTGAAAERL